MTREAPERDGQMASAARPALVRARERATIKPDELDFSIIELLRRDGRRSSSSVARQLGVAKQTVAKRLDRLLKHDAIRITARVDPVAFGFPIYCGIGVRIKPGSLARVGEQLAAMDHIAWVGSSTGTYDLLADAFLPDTDAVFEFLHERLASMPDIVETREWLVVRSAKYVYLWDGEDEVGSEALRGWTTKPGSRLAPARADDLDRAIIGLLREDGRRPLTDIARRVGVTEVTVASRVDRLLRTGAVQVIAHVNWPAIGFPVDVSLSIKAARGRAEEVGARLRALPSISFAAFTTGDYDIIAEAFLSDDASLFDFLNEQVGAIPGVVATDTCHILHVPKVNYMWEGERISHTALG
jgi:DNA-binding Lrp family transcriptional regulator